MINRNQLYLDIKKSAYGLSLSSVWQHIEVALREVTDFDNKKLYSSKGVALRRKLFLYCLEKLLKNEEIKLYELDSQKLLTIPIIGQLKLILDSWPPYNSQDIDDDLDDFGLWFFTKCPVGVAWVDGNDQYIWTT